MILLWSAFYYYILQVPESVLVFILDEATFFDCFH